MICASPPSSDAHAEHAEHSIPQVNLASLEAHLAVLAAPAPPHISPSLADIYALLGRPVTEAAADAAAALVAEVAGASTPKHSY